MKQTVTIEIANNAAMQILRSLAAVSLIKFPQESTVEDETPSKKDQLTARLNEIYSELDSSVDPFVLAAQAEVLEGDDW